MRVLLAEDEKITRVALSNTVAAEGHDVEACDSGDRAVDLIRKGAFDVVITDLRLPGCSGIEVLNAAKQRDPQCAVIIMTAYGTVETAVAGFKLGVYDYLTKPFSPEKLLHMLDTIGQLRAMESENRQLKRRIDAIESREIIGASPSMRTMLETLKVVARRDVTALIEGESGTGKELVARALHQQSQRGTKPFVAINCAAIPESLFESELFGHEKGSFSGAIGRHIGYLERANGGTVFLDDVDDLPPLVQVKLLRTLQERELVRIGGHETVRLDIRIVCATKVPLLERVHERRFREDLYYRLAIVPIHVPPLRERKEDIPLLVEHFLKKHRADAAALLRARKMICELVAFDWPGNVRRELENAVQRIIALPQITTLGFASQSVTRPAALTLPAISGDGEGIRASYHERMEGAEREMIAQALELAGHNVSSAARLLGLPRSTLRSKMEKHGIAGD